MSLRDWVGGQLFRRVHGNHLVYNACWEDPRLDRRALRLGPDDTVLTITSAGCNALDYALAGPRQVWAVDVNPRQNALLELKLAGIRNLRYPQFFEMFGRGRLDQAGKIYAQSLRCDLSAWARAYWDRWIEFFEPGNLRPFYWRGTSGAFAMLVHYYLRNVARLRPQVEAMLAAESVDQQRAIYEEAQPRLWSRPLRFFLQRDSVLAMLGVPRAQRVQIETQYDGGLGRFVQDCVEAVFARLPLADNYFWRVYITGQYTPQCCPEYLTPAGFQRLREGAADRISIRTDSVQGFLEKNDSGVSRFVLLDHMDWLSSEQFPLLEQGWQWIVRRAVPGARVLWRSAGLHTEFVDQARVEWQGRLRPVGELLRYDRPLAEQLHPLCRVHTYGSFHIADLAA